MKATTEFRTIMQNRDALREQGLSAREVREEAMEKLVADGVLSRGEKKAIRGELKRLREEGDLTVADRRYFRRALAGNDDQLKTAAAYLAAIEDDNVTREELDGLFEVAGDRGLTRLEAELLADAQNKFSISNLDDRVFEP